MKVHTIMRYDESPIAEATWELDDKARTVNKALAALSIEDHLKEGLSFEHKIVNEDEDIEVDTEEAPLCAYNPEED